MTAEEALDALCLLLDLYPGAEWEQVVRRITQAVYDEGMEDDDDCYSAGV